MDAMAESARHSHSATALVEVPAEAAFAFLADPAALGRWSLGCMDLASEGGGVWSGTSLFDGARGYLSIEALREKLLIDYHVGTAGERRPRISARVIPPEVCGLAAGRCYVTLTAWRAAGMDDDRWRRLVATHEAEIWLIKAQLERRARAGG
jgi:hypothetical protein